MPERPVFKAPEFSVKQKFPRLLKLSDNVVRPGATKYGHLEQHVGLRRSRLESVNDSSSHSYSILHKRLAGRYGVSFLLSTVHTDPCSGTHLIQ